MSITVDVIRTAKRKYDLDILRHKQWGSKRRSVYAWRRKNKPSKKVADTVFQHITVTRPTNDFKSDVRTVEDIGYNRFGSGASYNFIVNMKTGEVAAGMPLDAKGTHTINNKKVSGFSYDQNYAARAIAVLGMPDTPLSNAAEESIARLLAAMMDAGAITNGFDYEPHSLVAWKDCPCDPTRNKMGDIYRRAQYLRKNPPSSSRKKARKKSYTNVIRRLKRIRKRIVRMSGGHKGIQVKITRAIRRLKDRRKKV